MNFSMVEYQNLCMLDQQCAIKKCISQMAGCPKSCLKGKQWRWWRASGSAVLGGCGWIISFLLTDDSAVVEALLVMLKIGKTRRD